ncbi:hypothetical protein N0V91_007101 [Didymella pomorum]|uniref:Uncharacterized protein n=1 Tax=Didymella pomorum TaxID=749634 RepID=A0A9W8Z9N9_9PLEO|nr:hypothetical protein N0V91_007101 [Didymella pomorum]
MVQHAIKPQQARYILDRQDLLNFLKGKFDGKHPNHEFKIVDLHTGSDLVKKIADKNANK